MPKTMEEINAEKAAKPRPDLIPGNSMLAVGFVQAYGFGKHGPCTWTQAGTEQAKSETHVASAMRHMAEYLADHGAREGGSHLPVLWHAAAQVLIAIDCAILHEGVDLDAEAKAFVETMRQYAKPAAWKPEGVRDPTPAELEAAGFAPGAIEGQNPRRVPRRPEPAAYHQADIEVGATAADKRAAESPGCP